MDDIAADLTSQELLSSLGIKRPASESELSDGPSPKKAKAPRKKREPKIKAEPTAPSRTSSRLKRLSVDSEEHQRLLEEVRPTAAIDRR